MQGLIGPLKELAEFEELCKNKKKDVGMIRVCGCVNSQKSHMMYALGDGCKYKVIACSSETKAKQIYEEYRFLDSNTYLYPAKDFLFYQADIRSKELVKQRMEGIQAVPFNPFVPLLNLVMNMLRQENQLYIHQEIQFSRLHVMKMLCR